MSKYNDSQLAKPFASSKAMYLGSEGDHRSEIAEQPRKHEDQVEAQQRICVFWVNLGKPNCLQIQSINLLGRQT